MGFLKKKYPKGLAALLLFAFESIEAFLDDYKDIKTTQLITHVCWEN